MIRQNDIMKYKLRLTILLAAIFAAGLMSCSGDKCLVCGDETTAYHGKVYVLMTYVEPGKASVFVFDSANDSLLDTLMLDPYYTYHKIQVTPDGKYLLIGNGSGQTLVYDAATLTQVNLLDGAGLTKLIHAGTELFSSDGAFHPLSIRSIPDGEVLLSLTLPREVVGRLRYDSAYNLVYGTAEISDLYSSGDTTDIVIFNPDSLSLLRRFRVTDDAGQVYYINEVLLDFDSGVGHAVGVSDWFYYLNFDLETGKVRNRYALKDAYGDLEFSPGGSQVLVSEPGIPGGPGDFARPGPIYVFDAATGDYSGEISTLDLIEDPDATPLDIWDLAFTPDGSALYAVSSHWPETRGTVLKIDFQKRTLLKMLFPGIDRTPIGLAFGPQVE